VKLTFQKSESATERFYRLVWPHRAAVLRAALVLCGSTAEADDLSQELLMRAFTSLDQFREGDNAKPWLMTILRRLRIDRLRADARHSNESSLDAMEIDPPSEATEEITLDGDGANPDRLLNQFADSEVIHALQKLPEDIRWTLLLADVQQIDHHEIATILEVPVGTVKSRVSRGRQMLRMVLLPLAKDRRMVSEG